MAQREIPFMDVIQGTWPLFQSNLVLTIGVPAFLMLVPTIVVGLPICVVAFVVGCLAGFINKGLIFVAMFPIGLVGVVLFAAAYNAVRAGWTIIMLRMTRGQPCVFMDIKSGLPWFMNFFLTMLIIGIGTAVGTFCFIAPGVFFAVRTSLAPFLVIEENLKPVEALIRSNELVTGYSWQILCYYALYLFANTVAGLVPVANLILPIVAMGFFDLVLTRIYCYRIDDESAIS